MTGFGIDQLSKFVLVLLSYQISLSSDPGIFSSLANSPHHLDCLSPAGISLHSCIERKLQVRCMRARATCEIGYEVLGV